MKKGWELPWGDQCVDRETNQKNNRVLRSYDRAYKPSPQFQTNQHFVPIYSQGQDFLLYFLFYILGPDATV